MPWYLPHSSSEVNVMETRNIRVAEILDQETDTVYISIDMNSSVFDI